MPRLSRVPVLVALGMALCAAAASAQRVEGTLVEEGTETPIAGATVRLLDLAGAQGAVATTDRAGAWALRAPATGAYYRIRVERVGSGTVETVPFLVADELLHLTLATRPRVVMLEAVSVQALNHAALLARSRTRKSARTLMPEEVERRIERLRPRSTGRLVMNMIAALGVTWDDWPKFESVPLLNGQTASRGLSFGGSDFRSPWESAISSDRRACKAIVAVDGIPYFKARLESNLEELVPLTEVRAIEVYNDPNFVPRELDLLSRMHPLDRPKDDRLTCGVVMIWTREGLGIP